MGLTRNLFFLFAVTVFAITSTVLTVFNYSPVGANSSVLLNFYLSLAVSVTGIMGLIFYLTKVKSKKNETIYHIFWPSIRQAAFISFAICTLLYLKSIGVLDWLISLSVITISVLLELFFESKKIKSSIIKKNKDNDTRQPTSN